MRTITIVLAAAIMSACYVTTGTATELSTAPPPRGSLCVTHGTADTSYALTTDDHEFRAYAPAASGDVRLGIVAIGETSTVVPLASGTVRHQVCIKMRAADGCNLVYACWRAEASKLVVQTKINPGQHSANECGTSGYATVTPASAVAVPALFGAHVLEANLADSGALQLTADGVPSWTGQLDAAAMALSGPAGVRSDNVRWSGALVADVDCSISGD